MLLRKTDGESSKPKSTIKKLDEGLLKDYFDFGKKIDLNLPMHWH
ncbi:hypothetical protein QBE52_12320 [Clostridiaceae bacterium 35-E11]